MKMKDAVSALASLAHESRLELFRLLVKRGPDGYTPNEIVEKLEIPGSTLSFHLKELIHSGMISARKDGRFIYYSPDFSQVNALMDFLTEHCCSLSSNDAGCCVPKKSSKGRRKPATTRSKSPRLS